MVSKKRKKEGDSMKRFFIGAAVILSFFLAGQHVLAAGQQGKQTSQSAADDSLSGKVVETMNAGSYTYVLLEKNGKKTWAAVPRMEVKKGQIIYLQPGGLMENFSSRTLNRTFEKIYFSAGPINPSTEGTMGSKGKVIIPKEKIKVEKASGPNAYTIAEIYKNISRLDKKEAVVRGKVIKVSQAIMGKNWLHIQDGTGDPQKGTEDLVVTTKDSPAVGDVVTASGTIAKDRDFGSGYKYRAIMENAHIKK
jgi:hypothetical protein